MVNEELDVLADKVPLFDYGESYEKDESVEYEGQDMDPQIFKRYEERVKARAKERAKKAKKRKTKEKSKKRVVKKK